jgi:hypothetical protein
MGADLIAMGVTVDPNKARDRAEAQHWLNALPDRVINETIERADADPFGDRFDEPGEARDFILAGITEIDGWIRVGDRYTIGFEIQGSERLFFVAGGTSWGDLPFDAWDEVSAALSLPEELHFHLGIYPGIVP